MRAVAYIRVSRVGGRSGDSFISPEIQEDAISAMAQRLGLTIIETITELDVSGGNADRVGWQGALAMVESGKAEALIVYNLSRFSRSQLDALAAIDRIKAAGGRLHSAQEGSFDDSPSGTCFGSVAWPHWLSPLNLAV
jgi:DNA invertase Pin-like site-specific DNA recombinase